MRVTLRRPSKFDVFYSVALGSLWVLLFRALWGHWPDWTSAAIWAIVWPLSILALACVRVQRRAAGCVG